MLVLGHLPFLHVIEIKNALRILPVSAVWWVVPISAFFASLAVLDFIGWLFSRLTKRET